MSKHTRRSHPDAPVNLIDTNELDRIPSTLDPSLEPEATDEIERELGDVSREGHVATEDEIPEDEIFDEVRRAAEELPADTPVDRADQTDKRMENPPSGRDLSR